MGSVVSGAGDLNGDGYSDLVVNLPHGGIPLDNVDAVPDLIGKSLIYYGSSTGVNPSTPSFSVNNINDITGFTDVDLSLSSAGDLNGDGYGDLAIVTHPWNFHDLTEKSTCLIYHGNNSNKNLQNNLRLYNSNLTTIINQSQKAKNDFGAGLYAKSFLGGGKGKLVWETKPKGQGFSKGSNNVITNSTAFSGMQNSYASLGLKGTELKNVIVKQGASSKVRTRVKYDPALALTGQLYGPWRYVPDYLTGNSTAPAPENAVSDMSETIKAKAQLESEKFASDISIYPNPVTDKLFIESESADAIRSVQLLSVEGKSVYQSTASVKQIDVSKLAAGSYILVITHKDGVKNSRKVLITK